MKMSMEEYWCDIESEKVEIFEGKPMSRPSVRDKSHTASLGLTPGLHGERWATKRLSRDGLADENWFGFI